MGRLNDNQLKQLAEFTSNLGLVFAAVVVTPLFSSSGSVNIIIVLAGLIPAIICLSLSLLILRSKKK